MIDYLVCLVLVVCFTLSSSLSRSKFPCHFVDDYASVLVSGDRWALQGSWFPKTRAYLQNLLNRAIAFGVGHDLGYAALEVQELDKMRVGSQLRHDVRRSYSLRIARLDLRIRKLVNSINIILPKFL
ncbi:hypothetical protein BVRB_6g134570 [Beta vulgaris subsp. vulgaris]|nr:hypothetical protein BVRB_6g134570 [Beta vulgaris subsp. vulgaris]